MGRKTGWLRPQVSCWLISSDSAPLRPCDSEAPEELGSMEGQPAWAGAIPASSARGTTGPPEYDFSLETRSSITTSRDDLPWARTQEKCSRATLSKPGRNAHEPPARTQSTQCIYLSAQAATTSDVHAKNISRPESAGV
ncbi:hypothetical protein Mapa_010167 [Marchantia paleacea]|nr:hypothetical protein Mapa_010167 [Marchantia paleacea]